MSMDELVELEAFFPDIEPELPRCPTPVIENRIRDAIIDACERANIWRWKHPELPIFKGVQDYEFMAPTSDTLVHSVLDVSVNGRPLRGSCNGVDTHENVGENYRGYDIADRGLIRLTAMPLQDSSPIRSELAPSIPTVPVDPGSLSDGATQTEINTYLANKAAFDEAVVVYRAWVASEIRPYKGLSATVSIKPSRTTLEVAAVLHRDYYQLIRYGTLAKGLMMLNRPWSNPEMGKEMEKQYEYAIAKAKQGVDRGFHTGSQRAKPRRFA